MKNRRSQFRSRARKSLFHRNFRPYFERLEDRSMLSAVTLDLRVDPFDRTWEVFATVNSGDNLGLAGFAFDVEGTGGLTVATAAFSAPAGFTVQSQNTPDVGENIVGLQDRNTATTGRGQGTNGAILLAQGTYTGFAGTLAVEALNDGASVLPPTWQPNMNINPVLADDYFGDLETLEALLGDANRDGLVNGADFISVQVSFGQSGAPGILGDADLSGAVDAADFTAVLNNLGDSVSDNQAPVVDLNGADAGTGFSSAFTEGGAAAAIADTDVSVTDADDANLASATITLTNPLDGAAESLSATTTGTAIVAAAYNATTGVLTLTGNDTLANYRQVLASVRYNNTSGAPNQTARVITVVVNDGTTASAAATATVSVTGTNAAPTISVNAGVTVAEGASATIDETRLAVADSDTPAASRTFTVTVLPNAGELRVNGTALTANGTFTQANIDADQVVYAHGGGEGTSDSFTFTVSDGAGGSIAATVFNITVTPVNDPPTLAVNAGLTVAEGAAATTIGAARLSATDVESPPTAVTFTIVALPTGGTLSLNGTALLVGGTFTQDNIVAGQLAYAHGGGEAATDQFTFTVTDGSGGGITTTAFNITITPVNDAPVVATNSGLAVNEGALGTVNNTVLSVTDADTAPSAIVYTVTTIPTNGTLRLTGSAIAAGGTFTQADVNSGQITYLHGGGENTADSFTFTVSDGAGGAIPSTTFNISITLVNDAPVIATNAGLTLAEGAVGAIDNTRLSVTDADTPAASVVFTVGTAPTNGTLSLSGAPLAAGGTFTQADVVGGLLAYTHNAGETSVDEFTFTVSDGAGGTISSTPFSITITPVNDSPTLATNAGATVNEGGPVTIATAQLAATDVDNTPAQLTYTVTDLPDNGSLAVNGTALIAGGTFTQANIDANQVVYTHGGGETTSDSFSFTVADGAGGSIASTTFNITVTPQNDAPALDLDADDSSGETGADFEAEFTPGGGPVEIADTDATLTDADDANIESMTIVLTNRPNGADETLAATGTSAITVDFNATTGILTLSGSDTLANYLLVLATVVYDNANATPDETDRLITVQADDGDADSNVATSTIVFV